MITVLVIDDSTDFRENIIEFLELENFTPLQAENGELGIALSQQYMPDLILCDLLLPGMNGYEVLSALKTNPVTQSIPFIMMTGHTQAEDLNQNSQVGPTDYLFKPFSVDDILALLHKHLKK